MLLSHNRQQVKQKVQEELEKKMAKKKVVVEEEKKANNINDAFHGINPEDFDSDDILALKVLREGRNRWWKLVEPYKRINESMTQFADRCGFDRVAVHRWKTAGTKPRPENALKILKNLGVPDADAKTIFNKFVGIKETVATTEEGYVYPDAEGINREGRLGFRSIWLETSNINPASVKLVVCDTESMSPEIRPRDLMLVDMSKTTPRTGKTYLIEITDDPDTQIICKLFTLPNREISVVYENKEVYPGFKISQDLVLIHGEVVFIGRML